MRVLKSVMFFLCIAMISGCSPKGAVTPEIAFTTLRDAYRHNDSELFTAQLSTKSTEKIKHILTAIRGMDSRQCRRLAGKLGTDCPSLRRFSVKDYVALQLALDRKPGNSHYGILFQSDIVGKKTNSGACTFRTSNGMEISFVKEGAYWKLDLQDF